MLGLGWTEMLVIGVAALIFIGPKDLPVVMKRLGQITGQIRRMGNEFQREINKTTGLDEVRNLRNAITQPLKQTTDQIRKDFNAMTATGEVKPSGLIKPADPKAESVVDEIHAAAGMTPPASAPKPVASAKPVRAAKPVAADKPVAATKAVRATKPKKAPTRAKAAPTSPVVTAELLPITEPIAVVEAAAVAKPVRKRVAKKTEITAEAVPTAAPKKRATAKKPAVKAGTE